VTGMRRTVSAPEVFGTWGQHEEGRNVQRLWVMNFERLPKKSWHILRKSLSWLLAFGSRLEPRTSRVHSVIHWTATLFYSHVQSCWTLEGKQYKMYWSEDICSIPQRPVESGYACSELHLKLTY